MTERRQAITEIFDKGKPIDAAARRAVRTALGKPTRQAGSKSPNARRSRRRKAA